MSFNDPIAETITKIRNAKIAKHRFVDIVHSRMREEILGVLKEKGYIENFLVNKEKRKMRVFLKYTKSRNSVIRNLRRISTSSLRRYVGYRDIPKVFNGMGIAILSTPMGVMDGESARKNKVGGELLCTVW